ncbi:MAG TPA: uracil-DNA glycosylase family protein [Acidimicrobiales bacterium]
MPDAIGEVMALVGALRVLGSLNLYDEVDSVAWGDHQGAATDRRAALTEYLVSRWAAPVVLVGEAPGRNGARWTGVPFTSSHQLTGAGAKEPTATVVHRVVAELGWAADVLFWNASVLFPSANRDPRRAELDACAPVLDRVCRGRTVLAVGRHAERATGAPYVRHPSHGGATRFAEDLRRALGRPVDAGLGGGVPPGRLGYRQVEEVS